MNDDERFQLDYFIKESIKPKRLLKRYKAILDVNSNLKECIANSNAVADIGCGAYGGIFNAIKAPCMFGVDPLWDSYTVFPVPQGMIKVVGTFFRPNLPRKVDIIVTMDALNYCEDIKLAATVMSMNLNDGGSIFVHMNVRKKSQLNRWHKYLYTKDDIDTAFSSILNKTWDRFVDKDPLNDKKYPTYMGFWKR